jgi:predicted GNAT family N-acyltransferase
MGTSAEWRWTPNGVARVWGRPCSSALIDEAGRRHVSVLALSAQTHALGFYTRFGFVPVGPEYEEAGLPHQAMERRLAAD